MTDDENADQCPSADGGPMKLLHYRDLFGDLTACGLSDGLSTVSPSAVQCRDCLAALGLQVEDR